MKTFQFYQDIKVAVWQRQFFEIEAENEQDAKRLAIKFKNNDVSNEAEYTHTETLYDTEKFIPVDENGGSDTIQLYLRGEEYPFATNGNKGIKQMIASFDQFKDAHQVAERDMAHHTIEAVDCWGGGEFSAYHADGCLNIVSVHYDGTAEKYTFRESWHTLTGENEGFRKKMADFLVKRSEASAPYVHDWLAGHLTEMTRTSASVDNRVPFGLSEVVAVWGDHAEKKVFQPASLVGYQVVGEVDSYPFGLTSCDVIRSRQDALDRLSGASDESPAGGFDIYPVYEGEIPSPSFI